MDDIIIQNAAIVTPKHQEYFQYVAITLKSGTDVKVQLKVPHIAINKPKTIIYKEV